MHKLEDYRLHQSLEKNIAIIKEIFNNDDTLIKRLFQNQNNPCLKCCIFFIDGMVDDKRINEDILKPILENSVVKKEVDLMDQLQYQIISANNMIKSDNLTKVIEEPVSEKVLRGPREGFTECLSSNISMVRRKIQTNNLKLEFQVFGKQSRNGNVYNVLYCIPSFHIYRYHTGVSLY